MKALRIITALAALALAAGPAAAEMGYVGCSTPDTAYGFDLDTWALTAPLDLLPEGNYPYDATIKPDGLEVWIPGASGDGVVVISLVTNTIIARISTGEYPVSVAFNGDGTLALVSCRDSDRVDLISTNTYTVFGSLDIPGTYLGPGNIVFDPVSTNFYLVEWYDDMLFEIAPDGSAILRQLALGNSLWQLAVDTALGHTLYVTDRGTDQLRIVDPVSLTEMSTLPVGDDPWGVDVSADGTRVVVTCEDSHDVHVYEMPAALRIILPLGGSVDPRDVDIHDGRGLAYVTSGAITGTDLIYTIDLVSYAISSHPIPGANPNVVAVQAQAGSDPTAVAEAPASERRLALYPNPFNPKTAVRFAIETPGSVRLDVFSPDGRIVRRLFAGSLPAGEHEVIWDGRGGGGRRLASGVYLVRLETAAGVERRRAILLK